MTIPLKTESPEALARALGAIRLAIEIGAFRHDYFSTSD